MLKTKRPCDQEKPNSQHQPEPQSLVQEIESVMGRSRTEDITDKAREGRGKEREVQEHTQVWLVSSWL